MPGLKLAGRGSVTSVLLDEPFTAEEEFAIGHNKRKELKKEIILVFRDTGYAIAIPKDHVEKIDFQDIFIAVVNWPISELYGAFVCIMHYLDPSVTS